MTIRKYSRCTHFDHYSCPHKDDDIMKKATQNTSEFYGKLQYPDYPLVEEIDSICSVCNQFTQRDGLSQSQKQD